MWSRTRSPLTWSQLRHLGPMENPGSPPLGLEILDPRPLKFTFQGEWVQLLGFQKLVTRVL